MSTRIARNNGLDSGAQRAPGGELQVICREQSATSAAVLPLFWLNPKL